MSRGLQMLVEEGSIPHALMLCGASGAETCHRFLQKWPSGSKTCHRFLQKWPSGSKTAHRFCRNERREAKPSTVSSKNGKNCEFRGRNHQKTAKTADSVDGIIKKTEKTDFHPRMTGEKQ